MKAGSENKRRFKRIEEKSLIQFRGRDFHIYSSLANIGEGGLFMNTYYILDEGEEIDLKFDLPKLNRTIDVKGKVIRHTDVKPAGGERSVGLGVSFENLRDEDKLAIRNFVNNSQIT